MEGDRFTELVRDVRENGLLHPVVLFEGKILDGRNRYRACLEAEVAPRFEEFAGDDPVARVVSENLRRRDLSASQRAMCAAKAKGLRQRLEAEGVRRMAEAGSRNLPGASLPSSDINSRPSEDAPETAPRTVDRLGQAFDVSPTYVSLATKLQREDPEMAEQVSKGEMSLATARRRLATRPTEQPAPGPGKRRSGLKSTPGETYDTSNIKRQQYAAKQHRLLVDGMSGIRGYILGMQKLDLGAAAASDDITAWARAAAQAATDLKRLKTQIEEAGAHA